MAQKGSAKGDRVRRRALDDDKHVHTDIRRSVVQSNIHMAYNLNFAVNGVDGSVGTLDHLRAPYREAILNARYGSR